MFPSPGVVFLLWNTPGCSGISVPHLVSDDKLSRQASITLVLNTRMQLDKLLCGFTLHLAASRFNVALSGTAIQSSTYSNLGKAEHAMEWNSDPQWEHNSCTATISQAKPWLRLELPGVYRVSEIQVTNRNDVRERLNGVQIFIGNSLANNSNDNPS